MLQGIIAGKGGGGVITVNSMVGRLAMELGHHVLTAETHGMAMRGGSVSTSIKIGDFSSPSVGLGSASFILSLDTDEALRSLSCLGENGLCLINTASGRPAVIPDRYRVVTIDANGMARSGFNRPILAAQIMVGCLIAAFPDCFPPDRSMEILRSMARVEGAAVMAGFDYYLSL